MRKIDLFYYIIYNKTFRKEMRTQIVFIKNINREITFNIGKSQNENFDVIDTGNPDDLWFHAKNRASCHVVCQVPKGIQKNELSYIIKRGALLCKQNTNKLKSEKHVEFIYTQCKYVQKADIPGSVIPVNYKTVSC